MREPRSYIVRIYRRGFRSLSGVVEDTRTNTQHPFRDTEELIAVLRAPNSHVTLPESRGKFQSTK
jgi:hypothetical protein